MSRDTRAHLIEHHKKVEAAIARDDHATAMHHLGHMMALLRHGKHDGAEDAPKSEPSMGLRSRLSGMSRPK